MKAKAWDEFGEPVPDGNEDNGDEIGQAAPLVMSTDESEMGARLFEMGAHNRKQLFTQE